MIRNVLEYLYEASGVYPDKTAVIDENRTITYAALLQQSLAIGSFLEQRIVGDGQKPVLIFIDKSIECLASMLGVVQSGNFYIVLDIKTPGERLEKICDTLDNPYCITTEEQYPALQKLGYRRGGVFLYEEIVMEERDEQSLNKIKRRAIDTDLLYVLFTSGSTGVPKGVGITHRAVIDYAEAYTDEVEIKETDVLGNQSPFYFDVSLKDIYMSLKSKSTLCIIPSRFFMTPKKLLTYMEENKVSVIAWVPTAYRILSQFKALDKIHPDTLEKFIFSGEVMPVTVYKYWRRHYPEGTFIQQYGPTEITGACVNFHVEEEYGDHETIPIGKAFCNTEVFLLDEHNQKIEESQHHTVGEICVRGSCLAVGYFNNTEKTEQLFVQNPLQKNYPEKIYRTGDLGFWNDKEELVFVSRKDYQIKHSGHRIELGEIEAVIGAIPEVKANCCVHNRKKDAIIIYYVSDLLADKDMAKLCSQELPKYMMPSGYHKLQELPLLPNGKVNRKLLDDWANEGA